MDVDHTDSLDHCKTMDINQTDSVLRNNDHYNGCDDISDGELLEDDQSKSPDGLMEPQLRNTELSKQLDREDSSKENEVNFEKSKEYERERDKDHNSVKEKEKLRDREKHKDRDREKEKDKGREREKDRKHEKGKDETREREENKEKHRGKDRERVKERDTGRDRDKEGTSSKHRDKENRERTRAVERKKDHDVGYGDTDKQERTKDRIKDNEIETDPEISKDRKLNEREKDKEKEGHGRDKDKHREKDKDREKEKGREKEKDRYKEEREKDRDKPRERVRDREREKEKDRHKDERDKDRDKLRDRDRDRERDKEREKEKDKDRDRDRDREKDREKERIRDRERDKDRDKMKERNRDRDRERELDRDREREKEERTKLKDKDIKDGGKSKRTEARGRDDAKEKETNKERDNDEKDKKEIDGPKVPVTELEERIVKIREERLNQKLDSGSDILAWVNKSRKLEEQRNAEKEKAARLARVFEEQDNVETESDDEDNMNHSGKDLAGLKVLHGLDKVIEGGAVVLTLKDQNILAGDDVNDDVDMLENVEIGEQKARDEAYKAAKKRSGIYEDKFQNDINTVKTILPQYDDHFKEEAVTLDETGGINDESQKKLDEIRKRLQGAVMGSRVEESLAQTISSVSDYYTQEELLQFKKPKKKKKLRKKDKLDVDALEAEAVAAGLGDGDLGSRDNTQRRSLREEAAKTEAEQRKNAYESAYKKAAEASRALRGGNSLDEMQVDDGGDTVFGEEDEVLYKSLEKARKAALKKQAETLGSGPQAIARLAVTANQLKGDAQSQSSDAPENKVVFTEMEEFVWSLQLDEESQKPASEDVFKEDDEAPEPIIKDVTTEAVGGWTEVKEEDSDHPMEEAEKEEVHDEIIKEVTVGKGLAGALQLLKERGAFNETVDWGGRNMDKKKSKLVGVRDNDGPKEIQLDRLDEFGRVMTPKEAFRKLSHKFHGKGPGKMKQEKRMKQYQEELKLKQMNTGDTPLHSMEKVRDVQAKLRTPYLVLSGQIKPGQTSDPRSGFATVEKETPGSLTPMLGDRKVEHFLGIKRKPEDGAMGPPKKQKM